MFPFIGFIDHKSCFPSAAGTEKLSTDNVFKFQTMILLMKELSWNRIAIVYEDDTYGRDGAISLHEHAETNLICVSKMFAISVTVDGDVSLVQINAGLDEIMLQSPVIEGVILFASKPVANKVLFAVDNKGVANVPLFILSESVGLQDDVFRSSGTILEKTKGSMSVSVAYTEVTSFTEYWLSLFTNQALFDANVGLNPWLYDVLADVTGCDQPSSCSVMTAQEAESKFPKQSVYLKYGIVAAHTMAKALLQVYNKLCSETSNDCLTDFKNNFKPHLMTDEMKDLSVDFGTDFEPVVSVEPLTTTQYQLTFGNLSDPTSRSDQDIYQVYNYRQQPNGGPNDFSLLEVCFQSCHLHLNLLYIIYKELKQTLVLCGIY